MQRGGDHTPVFARGPNDDPLIRHDADGGDGVDVSAIGELVTRQGEERGLIWIPDFHPWLGRAVFIFLSEDIASKKFGQSLSMDAMLQSHKKRDLNQRKKQPP